MSNITLSNMAYGDIRIVSFLWSRWLLPGDSLTGTPTITVTAPLSNGTFISLIGSTVTCSITAGNFTGTAQVSCEVTSIEGERATRTAFVPIVPLAS